MLVVHIILAVGVVLAMDWATYDRILLSGEVLWGVEPGYCYRDTLIPRVIVTSVSGAMIGIASTSAPINDWLFFIGVGGSVLSVLYAIIATSVRQRRLGP
jgi:hypothetical protein